MDLILDTNILLAYVRSSKRLTDIIEADLLPHGVAMPTILYSIVSRGELLSLGLQADWGSAKQSAAQAVLNNFLQVDINASDIVKTYSQIDAYSQGKLAGNPMPKGLTSRNMGKNDLWIAATAIVTGAKLVTTDDDFDHLTKYGLKLKNYSYLLKP